MKYGITVLFIMLSGPLLLFFPVGSFAERVPHHDTMIESEGTVADCLACHDGAQASAVSYCTVQCDFRSSHSINKPYPPRNKRDLYAPLEAVAAKGVRIVNGRVTCISCHNMKNPGKFHLVVDNASNLCVICHFKMTHSR